MKKLSIFLLFFLCLSTLSLASTPDFTITTNFVTTLNNSNGQNVGSVVIARQAYITNITTITDVVPVSIQNFDTIIWQGNGSILIKNSLDNVVGIIDQGQSYVFSTAGTYSYFVNGQSNVTSTISVSSETIPSINLTVAGLPIVYHLPQSVVLDTNSKVFNVTADVSVDISSSNYSLMISASFENITKNVSSSMYISSQQTWVVQSISFASSLNAKAGDVTSIGQIVLNSTGNSDVNISSSISGNGSFMVLTQQSQTLFRKSTTSFGLTIQVPLSQADGIYNSTIALSGGGLVQLIPLTIVVKDTTPPTILSINTTDQMVQHNMLLKAIITDNLHVKNVTVDFYHGTTIHTTLFVVPQQMTADQQYYFYNFTPNSLEPYFFKVCASDDSDNSVCNETSISFTQLNIIQGNSVFEVPARKYGNIASTTIFNLTEPIPDQITITLVDLTSNIAALNYSNSSNVSTATSYHLNIIDGDGGIRPLTTIGQTIVISKPGQIKLQVQGDVLSQYQGVLRITVPPYVQNVSDYSFSGKFLDYDIPQPFVIPWLGKTLNCGVVDTGDLTTSYYNCVVQLPISSDVQNLAIPVTPEQLSLQNQTMTNTVDDLKSSISFRTKIISVLAMLVVIAICLVAFVVRAYPYLRMNLTVD